MYSVVDEHFAVGVEQAAFSAHVPPIAMAGTCVSFTRLEAGVLALAVVVLSDITGDRVQTPVTDPARAHLNKQILAAVGAAPEFNRVAHEYKRPFVLSLLARRARRRGFSRRCICRRCEFLPYSFCEFLQVAHCELTL